MSTHSDVEKFLQAVFGSDHGTHAIFAYTVANPGPKAKKMEHVRTLAELDNERDCYWSIAAYPPGYTGTNTEDAALEVRALVVDDVGTKGPSEGAVLLALGEPTAITRTSTGNYQWAYRLLKPVAKDDWAGFFGGIEALIGHSKPLEARAAQTLMRLPMGINTKGPDANGKMKLDHGGTFRVELVKINPEVALDPDTIVRVAGRSTRAKTSSDGGWAHDIAGLMALIPNNDVHYDDWFDHAERAMAAAIDKDTARPAFEAWSEKSVKHDLDEIELRWPTVDPTRTSGKELLAEAQAADPEGYKAWQVREEKAAFPDTPDPIETGVINFSVDQEKTSLEVVKHFAGRIKQVGRGDWREFDEETGRWREWTGDHMMRRVLELVCERKKVVLDPDVSKKLGSIKFIEGIARAAGLHRDVIARATDYDRAPLLLGVPSGVIDLRPGRSRTVRKGLASEMVSKAMWVDPAPVGTPCLEWTRFLVEFTRGKPDLARWLQARAGYCLTGLMDEPVMPYYYGSGGNGKSVYLNALRSVWGEYGTQMDHRLLFEKQGGYHLAPLAVLAGVRLAVVTDVPSNAVWDVHIMKMLTGDDAITANRMHQNPITFKSTAKIDASGNGEPTVKDMDEGIRRRLKMLPMIGTPKVIDKQLGRKLYDEYPAILAWALEGLDMYWKLGGFPASEAVDTATTAYHIMLDPFQRWLDEHVVKDASQGAKVSATDLFRSWDAFRCAEGKHSVSPTNVATLGRKMKDKGFYFSTLDGRSYLRGYRVTADNVF